MNAKIRNAQNQKIPWMFIVGDKEKEGQAVSLRLRTGQQTNGLPLDEVVALMNQKIKDKEEL
jgi:threonyl-tRNA synthetase